MEENIRFERISEGNDLINNNAVDCLFQDSTGFVWYGSFYGIGRYDGYDFKIFSYKKNDENSIPINSINKIYSDGKGNLIIMSNRNKMIEFNAERENFRIINLPFIAEHQETFRSLFYDIEEGDIWVGTKLDGLYKFKENSKHFEKFSKDNWNLNSNFVSCLYFDKRLRKLLIGNKTGGINAFDFQSQSFSSFWVTKDILLQSMWIREIFKDSMDNFWICTDHGLFLFDTDFNFIEKFTAENAISHNMINCICEDKNGNLWIGTERGLNCYDTMKGEFTIFCNDKNNPDSIFSDSIKSVICDTNNTIIFGTYYGGIGKIDLEPYKFHCIRMNSSEPRSSANDVSSIYKDYKNNIWIGTYKGGFYKCYESTNEFTFKEFNELKGLITVGITGDKNDNVWVITNTSLSSINIFNDAIKLVDTKIFSDYIGEPFLSLECLSSHRSNSNHIWICVNGTFVLLFDTESTKFVNDERIINLFKNVFVSFIFSDSKNILWVGTKDHGLYEYNTESGEIENFVYKPDDEYSLSDNYVTSIIEDHNKDIWIGTYNDGFNKFIPGNNKFERFLKHGLRDAPVANMIVDDDNFLWISGNTDLIKFNSADNTFMNFTEDGNVKVDNANYYASHIGYDGTIYFGTTEGVVYFNPREIKTNTSIANIVLTDFKIFYEQLKPSQENPFLKESITYAKEITLSYRESVISFEFAALIFKNPKKNQYAYKMEGFDKNWVYCGTRRTATYTNLDPGEYTFRVKGSNNDGLWNEEGTSIKIIITPPWYKTILFKSLVGLSLIGSIGSFYQKRIQKLNKEKRQQEEFTKKLIESQENERKRVAAELHDSLGQDLLIIKNKLLTSIKKTDDEKSKEKFKEISELTSATLDNVREISYNLRPYELDRLGLTKTIESMIERANSSTNINFIGNIDDIDKIFIPEVEINIYRIIQESLNNVIKHSEAKDVIVCILKKEKEIVINISDDGKGFNIRKYNMNSKKKGFGLKGIEERVRLLEGEFIVNSADGKGTELKIFIPVS